MKPERLYTSAKLSPDRALHGDAQLAAAMAQLCCNTTAKEGPIGTRNAEKIANTLYEKKSDRHLGGILGWYLPYLLTYYLIRTTHYLPPTNPFTYYRKTN